MRKRGSRKSIQIGGEFSVKHSAENEQQSGVSQPVGVTNIKILKTKNGANAEANFFDQKNAYKGQRVRLFF